MMNPKQRWLGLASAVSLIAFTQVTLGCGETKRGGGDGGGNARGGAADGGGMSAGAQAVGGASGSRSDGTSGRGDGGSAGDGVAGAGAVSGFAADFLPRAQAALKAAAPAWTCATTLPLVPVEDREAVHDAVRAFIAAAVDVAPADISMTTQECSTPSTISCADTFAHDTAKSGGSIYDTARPLALELEAKTADVEVSIWVATKDGITLPGIAVMTGISDGVLVGMAVFNSPEVCN
jgi:hypothetical protein